MPTVAKYGALWSEETTPLEIEFYCIKQRGSWIASDGKKCGWGLSYHLEAARKIIWPNLDDHRWNTLCRNEIARPNATITVLMGAGSTGKTHTAAWIRLLQYYASPEDTLVLVSSTDTRGLELRVWGEIKMLHGLAQESFPDLIPGHLVDSKHLIASDDIGEDDKSIRDLRKGIVGIPTVQNGKFVGLGKWAGIKQKNVYLVADEAQFMGASFLSAFANLDKNERFEAIVLGNPNDMLDPLGKAAEPRDGWESHMEPTATDCWDTRFMNGRCVNLVGTDSPNFDFPEDQPTRYKYLISREKIAKTVSFFAKDSLEYYSQCKGVMRVATVSRRVITPALCRQFGALGDVVWKGTPLTRIGMLDAAYGGDRCVFRYLDFGQDITGKILLSFSEYMIVPVRVRSDKIPEDQISEWVKATCVKFDIPPQNFFYDSTGRGSLGTSLSRIWSPLVNPVEFGGRPTDRPVSADMYVHDSKTGQKRLKKCSEHYVKFVTELWFSLRYAIEAGQVRNLGEEVMEEASMREYDMVAGDKREIETKDEMKERAGRSPDLADCTVIGIEGARRKGFQIARLANAEDVDSSLDWFRELQRRQRDQRQKHALNYAA